MKAGILADVFVGLGDGIALTQIPSIEICKRKVRAHEAAAAQVARDAARALQLREEQEAFVVALASLNLEKTGASDVGRRREANQRLRERR
jgi:hypothetical protein